MRRTVTALLVVGMLAAGACSEGDGELASDLATTTTTAGDITTTTSSTPTTGGDEGPGEDGPSGGGFDDEGPGGGDAPPGADPCVEPSPVWVSTHAPTQTDPEECEEGPQLGTGDVQITLRWSSSADLDLHVTEPDGTELWYGDKGPTATGGRLDVDSNIGCDEDGSVENVFWPEGQMPVGDFLVEVDGFSVDGCGGGDYTITAQVDGEEVLNETGSVGEDETDSFEFTT